MNAFFKVSAIAAAAASLVTALPATAAVTSHTSAPITASAGLVDTFLNSDQQASAYGRERYSREDRRRGYRDRYRYDRGNYRGDYRASSWRGRDGRYYCRRSNGTTGLLVGGAAGALLGREIDGGYDRTAGTVIGAAAGALLGREVDRGGSRCR